MKLKGWLGAALLAVFALMAFVGPLVAPFDPTAMDTEHQFLGPSAQHWLGTDHNGVDVLSQLLYGARLAFLIGTVVVGVCTVIGVTLGVVAGYVGGIVDEVLMRVVDVLMAFPGLLLNLAIVAVMKEPSTGIVVFALTLNGWVGYARLARGQVLTLRERDYVSAARAVGVGAGRIMGRHIVPNLLSPLLVQMTLAFGGVIAAEASLSFLGVGPPVPYTWGMMLDQGRAFIWKTQRLAFIPGLAIALVIIGCNLLGDALRDRLDPRRDR